MPEARLLAVLASLVTLCLILRLIWRLHGLVPALVTVAFLACDSWLLYVQRVSYIENTLTVIIVAGFLMYERALREPSARRFLLAGIVLGFAFVFKHTAFYVLPAVLLNWLIMRRVRRNHWVLLVGVGAVIAVYLAVMIPLFDPGRHDWYLQQSLIQLQQVLGLRVSRGTLVSPGEFLHLLSRQYAIFIPSLAAALAGVAAIIARCARSRSLQPLRDNSLLVSWAAAGIVVFGLSSLRYPQYFELVLIPMYCLLCTEACRYVRTHPRALPAATAAGLVIAVADLSTFYVCVLSRNDNVLYQTQQYVQSHIPAGSVVLTEEEIGDQIQQQWCAIARAGICGRAATYAITYTSYLQPAAPAGDNAFYALMKGATRVQTFQGFKETVIVWRLRGNAPH